MKKQWIITIEKTYSDKDYENQSEAEKQFIEDIAHNNFKFRTTVDKYYETNACEDCKDPLYNCTCKI